MIVFWLLLALFGATYLLAPLGIRPAYLASHRARACLALGIWFTAAGMLHFLATNAEIVMMPAILPFKYPLMYISGVAEVLGGIGLLIPRYRAVARYEIIALLLAVFPANVNVAINHITGPGLINDPAQQWIRLPLQFVLIGIILWATQHTSVQTATEVGYKPSAGV